MEVSTPWARWPNFKRRCRETQTEILSGRTATGTTSRTTQIFQDSFSNLLFYARLYVDFLSATIFFATRLSQGALPWIWLSPSLILRLQFTYMTIWMKVALHDFKFALVWEVAFDLELVRGLTFQHKHPLRRYSKAFRNKNLSMNTPTKSADGDTLPIDIESLSFITKYNH